MKRTWAAMAVWAALLGLSTALVSAQRPDGVGDYMRIKLVHCQKVLEGIALADFQMIAKHAQEMSLISRASNWEVINTPEYLQHSIEFRRAVEAIRDAAQKQNIDAAALAYVDVTMKCVNCHKHVRAVRMARHDYDALQRR
jgi:hypothetical protein